MKKYYLILVFFFSFLMGFAQSDSLSIEEQQRREKNIQAGNPFKKFGYKPKISTLSQGKYLEFHDLDSVVQIGTFTYHVKKKVITGFIVNETKYSEATLRPEIISRWMSPDPLSEEFPSWSPYNFTYNNPIFFTDPTGLAAFAYDNDYGIDQNGNIELIEETEDKFDRLYAVDEDGNKKDINNNGSVSEEDAVTINDQSILPELDAVKEVRESSYHGTKRFSFATRGENSQDDIFKIFNFAANNSNVEWSLARAKVNGENLFGIGTYQNRSLSPGYVGSFDVRNVISEIHSHPNITASMHSERGSLAGDRMRETTLSKRGINFSYYTYFPNSRRIFSIDKYGPSFIRNTNGQYKRFYFGTLNSK